MDKCGDRCLFNGFVLSAAVHGYDVYFVLGLSNELAFAFPCLHRNSMNILMRSVM
jgi:hypothetical protein